jgi:hypothetical protein
MALTTSIDRLPGTRHRQRVTLTPDRGGTSMGVFDRLFQDDAAPEPGESPSSNAWSEEKQARWGSLFAGPEDALGELVVVGERLGARRDPALAGLPPKQVFGEEALEDLQSYAVAAQALKPDRGEVAARPELYRRVADAVLVHLARIPEVTAYRLTGGFLRAIGEDVRDADDEALASLGAEIRKALREAREARKSPALERRDDLEAGTTTSLSEQYRAQYESQGGSMYQGGSPDPAAPTVPAPPEEPEEPLPPATDLTAEAVFRVLLEECLGDGRISRAEARAIAQLRDLLGLSLRRHQAMLEEVMAAVQARGPDPAGEDMDPLTFFERCCRVAMADGAVEVCSRRLVGTSTSRRRSTPRSGPACPAGKPVAERNDGAIRRERRPRAGFRLIPGKGWAIL